MAKDKNGDLRTFLPAAGRTGPPRLGIIGYSGSGKTTLMVALIESLGATGIKIGAIKHHPKEFSIDYEGKDSWRFSAAGACKTIVTGPKQTALIENTHRQRPLAELAADYLGDLDLILIEGFKRESFPKIEVQRPGLQRPLLTRDEGFDPDLIAVVSERGLELDVPVFSPGDLTGLTAFIRDFFSLPRPVAE